jgi:hypothetical protein
MAHPSHEHFLPLLYAAGAVDKGESCRFMTPNYQGASVAMRSVVWGEGLRADEGGMKKAGSQAGFFMGREKGFRAPWQSRRTHAQCCRC